MLIKPKDVNFILKTTLSIFQNNKLQKGLVYFYLCVII
jgi:hypothetical protein